MKPKPITLETPWRGNQRARQLELQFECPFRPHHRVKVTGPDVRGIRDLTGRIGVVDAIDRHRGTISVYFRGLTAPWGGDLVLDYTRYQLERMPGRGRTRWDKYRDRQRRAKKRALAQDENLSN
jgi:hypothetical protein